VIPLLCSAAEAPVSLQTLMVAPGKGYNVFAGRDASKALGKSSMKAEDLSADYSELTEWELKVLDDWVAYYTKVCISVFAWVYDDCAVAFCLFELAADFVEV